MSRTVRAARVQLANLPLTVGIPWAVLTFSFLIGLAFSAVVARHTAGGQATGGLASIYCVVLIGAFQSMTQMFPFATGLSLTRRTFFAATSLVAVAQAVVYGTVIYLLSVAEVATDGWGYRMMFFSLPFLPHHNPPLQILTYAAMFLLASYVGLALGAVVKRWGTTGAYVLSLGLVATAAGLAVLATWQHWWTPIGQWLSHQPAGALWAGWPAVLAAVFAAIGYLVLRRTTP